MVISDVVYTPATPADRITGLIGFIRCRLDHQLQVDGIALRRTADGRRTLSFPAKLDGHGNLQFFLKPLDDATRRHIEREVFRALGLEEDRQG